MITTTAVITDVITENTIVYIQVKIEGKYFPATFALNTSSLSDITKLLFLIQRTKAKNVKDLIDKKIRVIDTEEMTNSLVAVRDLSKNKFVDINGKEFPVRERRIYRRYQ